MQKLRDPKLNVPRTPLDVLGFMSCASVLIDVLLSPDHPGSMAYRAYAVYWRRNVARLASALPEASLPPLFLSVMRSTQLTWIEYVNSALKEGMYAAAPDFSYITQAIERRTFHNLSQMPDNSLVPRNVSTTTTTARPVATLALPPVSTPGTSESRMGSRLDATPAHIHGEWLKKFEASSKTLAVLKLEKPRPTTVSGSNLCLSYHLRGKCFDNCRDKATHRALTPGERSTVAAFLEKIL